MDDLLNQNPNEPVPAPENQSPEPDSVASRETADTSIPGAHAEEAPVSEEPVSEGDTDQIPAPENPVENSSVYGEPFARAEQPDQCENFNKPPVHLAEVRRIPLKASERGVKIFALVLAAVILLTCCAAGGYLLGLRNNTGSTSKTSSVILNLKSKPSDTAEYSAAEVYKKANTSVVGIAIYNDNTASSASGVIFSKDGYIITNDHVYDGIAAPKFFVYTSDGKEYKAKYVAGDTRSDLAVLKIEGVSDLTPAVFGDSGELYIGEQVVAVGRPINASTDSNLTTGIISLLDRRLSVTSSYSVKYIQTDTPLNPGSSGGALVNMYGQVVGITAAKISGTDYEGLGFAIPSVTVKRVVVSLIKNGYVEGRARLGISYNEVDAVAADIYGYSRGLYVATVDPACDAYGKINVGDIITSVNGTDIESDDVILDVIEAASPGDTLTLTVRTKTGSTTTLSIKLSEDKGSSSYSTAPSKSGNTSSATASDSFNFPFGD